MSRIGNNQFGVERAAQAIANLGWSYLSDSEQDVMGTDDEFFEAVMTRVRELKGPSIVRQKTVPPGQSTKTELAITIDPDGKATVQSLLSDGSWTYAIGDVALPCALYVTTTTKYDRPIRELERMLNSPKLREQDFQDFFEAYPELLKCGEYAEVIPQASIIPTNRSPRISWRADFILTPIDQNEFAKIVELKLPTCSILGNDRSGHAAYCSQLYAAVRQLKDYGQAFEESQTRLLFRKAYGVDVFLPRLELIVGRRWRQDQNQTMFRFQKDNRVEVHNWDSYVSTLRAKLLT